MCDFIINDGFNREFTKLLEKANASCYEIAHYCDLDQAYLSRLKRGDKSNPSPEIILKICFALVHVNRNIKLADIEKLCNSAGRTLFQKII